ncbi:MAG: hypothetical protein ABI855_15075 [Bacteroidota bacterium]
MKNTYFVRGVSDSASAEIVKRKLLNIKGVESAEMHLNPDCALVEMSRSIPIEELQKEVSPEQKYLICEGAFPIWHYESNTTFKKGWVFQYKQLILFFMAAVVLSVFIMLAI